METRADLGGLADSVLEVAPVPAWRHVAATMVDQGVTTLFGLLGSGNFHLAAAISDLGVGFVSARHEGSAVAMADGYARASGRIGVVTTHQGPGLTNLLTGLVEAVKSGTPLLVLAADTARPDRHANFRLDQAALVGATGAIVEHVYGAATADQDARRALERVRLERRPVVLMLPLDVQYEPVLQMAASAPGRSSPHVPAASPAAITELVGFLRDARRPLILAGRGAVLSQAGPQLELLAERTGALLATTAAAKGLFHDSAYDLGICGGFSSPFAARRIADADAIAVFGASLNPWTAGHGTLLDERTSIAQIEADPTAIGARLPVELGIIADCALAAEQAAEAAALRPRRDETWRTPQLAAEIATSSWRLQPFEPIASPGRIDPRTLTIALDELLPDDRLIAVDSGHFVGWPSMFMRVDDPTAFVFPQAFQSVGLGLGAAIGAAIGRPQRLAVGMLGDGGALMALGELETVARLSLPLLLVVYNDAAYGAEVHYFDDGQTPLDALVRFPECDFAAVARALGIDAVTVTGVGDLDRVEEWLEDRSGPLLVDARIEPTVRASWHEGVHDFR